MPKASRPLRRVLLVRDPLRGCVVEDIVERLRAIGDVLGYRVDDLADTAYIVIDTTASDYALTNIALRWRIWEPRLTRPRPFWYNKNRSEHSVSDGRPATGVN